MKRRTVKNITHALVVILISTLLVNPGFAQKKIEMGNRFMINKDGSYIQFKTTMAGFPVVRGSISAYQANMFYDPEDVMSSSATIRIGSESFTTSHPNRDKELLGEHFLNSTKFPAIWFQGDQVTLTDVGFDLTGEMNIKEIVKPVTIHMNKPTVMRNAMNNMDMMMASGTFKINRKDFELGTAGPWGSNPMLGDEIEVEFNMMGFSYTIEYLKDTYVKKVNGHDHAVGVVYKEVLANGVESAMTKMEAMTKESAYKNDNWLANLANIGWILLVDKHGKEAVAFFEKALEFNPNHTTSLLRLGDAYTVAGEYDKALAHFKKERSLPARIRFTHIPQMIKMLSGEFELKNMK